jgi:hypothetical protein
MTVMQMRSEAPECPAMAGCLQEVTTRLPGRTDTANATFTSPTEYDASALSREIAARSAGLATANGA